MLPGASCLACCKFDSASSILPEPPVKLRHAEIVVGGAGFQLRQLLELRQRFGVLILGEQRLRETVAMAGIVRIELDGLAVGIFGLGIVFRLRVGIAQQIVDIGRGGIAGRARQQIDRFLRAAFVDQQLAQLFERGAVVRLALDQTAQHLFGFRMAILEAVKAREPQRRIRVRGIDFQDGLEFRDGLLDVFLLHVARAHVARARERKCARAAGAHRHYSDRP